MPKVNDDGWNSPIVEIFNGYNKLLKYPDGRPLGRDVSRFTYTYDENGDDTCRIVLQVDDPSILDHPALRPDVLLYVRWGYSGIENGMSPKRLVAVRDTDTQYTTNGIRHELICTDKCAYLKTMQHNEATRKGFAEWVSGISRAKIRDIQIRMSLPKIGFDRVVIDYGTEPAALNELTGYISTAIDNTAVAIVRPVVPAGQSVYRVIKTEVEAIPDGPYVVDGRDDKLDIRPRGFDKPIRFKYHIAAGDAEVVSFIPKTEIRKSEMGVSQYGGVNPEDGTAVATDEIDMDGQEYRNLYGFDTYLSTAGLTQEEIWNQELAQSLWTAYKFAKDNGLPPPDPNEVIARQTVTIERGRREGAYTNEGSGYIVTARDNTSVFQRFTGVPKSIFWLGADNVELLNRIVNNDIGEKHQRKYKATLNVIGNPALQVNMNLSIGGQIAGWHKGTYYIEKVSHKIGMDGYTCEANLLKKPVKIVVVEKNYVEGVGERWKETEQQTDPYNVIDGDEEAKLKVRQTFQELLESMREEREQPEQTTGSEDWSEEARKKSEAYKISDQDALGIGKTGYDPLTGQEYETD